MRVPVTLAMPDSADVANLPAGYDAYLGYADGRWPTAVALAAKFPVAHRVILTVTGATLEADGCDVENGDLTIKGGADWARRKLAVEPGFRPVLYASVSTMPTLIGRLSDVGILRSRVRLHSAHYGWAGGIRGSVHICGPATCAWPGVPPMDGTQWTSTYPGVNGAAIDMSLLEDGFFGLTWTERLVQQLPVVRVDDSGEAVRTVQGALCARNHLVAIDGVFGWQTQGAVSALQRNAGIHVDGVVGPQTWPVLLGIAS